MTERIVINCPFCGKPHTVSLSKFESEVEAINPKPLAIKGGFWPSLWGSDFGLAVGLGGAIWLFTRVYDYSPLWAVGVGLGAGFGLPVLRLVLSRPVNVLPKPDQVKVHVQIDDVSDGGFTRYLDTFRPELVQWDDLIKLSRASGFSRSEAVVAGLSQDKWHKIKSEFLRLNYCVPLPNNANGYALSIRGRRLLAKIRDTSTNNNKQQGEK
jgi:hypothetical protein